MPAVHNPYAKNKKNPKHDDRSRHWSAGTSAAAGTAAATSAAAAARGAPPPAAAGGPVAAAAPATFSQSFQSIERTGHYRREERRQILSRLSEAEREARAQQRAMDDDDHAGIPDDTNGIDNRRTKSALPSADAGGNDTTAAATTTSTTTGSGTGGGTDGRGGGPAVSSLPLSDRDHHALLQPHVLYVSKRQRGNGVLDRVRNVPIAYAPAMVPDYILGPTRCALFLSCKYHALYPNYIHRRIAELKTDFALRVLLVLVDVEDNAGTLLALNRTAVLNRMTMICAWSEEEAGRYLETIKAFDGKDATLIQKKEQTNFVDQVSDFLTSCRGVNRTDSNQVLAQFGSLRSVAMASMDELGLVPGMGEVKVKRLYDAFHKPFSKKRAAANRKRRRDEEYCAKQKQQQQQQQEEEDEEALQKEEEEGAAAEKPERNDDASDSEDEANSGKDGRVDWDRDRNRMPVPGTSNGNKENHRGDG